MDLDALRERLCWLRFDYHRSFRRANAPQVRRVVRELFARPAASHPRMLVSIGLTHRCQARCAWCATGAYRKDARGELTTAEVRRLLARIACSRHVIHNVSFLGGECLLRRDLDVLVRAATDLGLSLHLSTNGLALDAARVRRLLAAGLHSVFVAASAGAPANAAERAKHERVVGAVRACVEEGLPCFLSVCVTRDEVRRGDAERVVALARELGVAGVRLFAVRRAGMWLWQGAGQTLEHDDAERLRRLCRSGFAFLTDDASRVAGRRCAALARRIAYVSPYGELQPCHFFPFSFGDVREGDFDAALERMWAHAMLRAESDDCVLHDETFRARHFARLRPERRLPVDLVATTG